MADSPASGAAARQSKELESGPLPRPSLLPAFEPFSSSPGLPRPSKRKFDDHVDERKYYPTPVPTSSTGILPSSPPARSTRPGIQRTVSTLSERAPLGAMPTLEIPSNGEPVLMGRSSNSSDYQLSSNRLISRVHISAKYHVPDSSYTSGHVEVECLGWNGIKVHCRGEVVELAKGGTFVSNKPAAQIMVDVQDTRVMLVWPKENERHSISAGPGSPFDADSPTKRRAVPAFASSPPAMLSRRPQSPVSPTPVSHSNSTFSSTFRAEPPENGTVQVYEDHSSDEDAPGSRTPVPTSAVSSKASVSGSSDALKNSQTSLSSEPDELSEHDEENDPIVHSFGPFGENILSRFESIKSASPERQRKPLVSSFNSPGHSSRPPPMHESPIKNHVINQLAYSRVHSLPLSTIHSNLPAELRGAMAKPSDTENINTLSSADLKTILDKIPCVGEIPREGKDAAGKLLESEFYYVPEMDQDEMRKDAVTSSLGKTGLRAARKTHKVCWPDQIKVHPLTRLLVAILLEETARLSPARRSPSCRNIPVVTSRLSQACQLLPFLMTAFLA